MKSCPDCKRTEDIVSFHGKFCSGCYDKKKRAKAAEKNVGLSEGQLIDKALKESRFPTSCNRCQKVFNENAFKFDKKLGKFRNPCTECSNSQKYYDTARSNKRKENEEDFLKKNAEYAREYRKRKLE